MTSSGPVKGPLDEIRQHFAEMAYHAAAVRGCRGHDPGLRVLFRLACSASLAVMWVTFEIPSGEVKTRRDFMKRR